MPSNVVTEEQWDRSCGEWYVPGGISAAPATGLSKREHFAGLAMQVLLHVPFPTSINGSDVSEYELCANAAVRQADALLKELEK